MTFEEISIDKEGYEFSPNGGKLEEVKEEESLSSKMEQSDVTSDHSSKSLDF